MWIGRFSGGARHGFGGYRQTEQKPSLAVLNTVSAQLRLQSHIASSAHTGTRSFTFEGTVLSLHSSSYSPARGLQGNLPTWQGVGPTPWTMCWGGGEGWPLFYAGLARLQYHYSLLALTQHGW